MALPVRIEAFLGRVARRMQLERCRAAARRAAWLSAAASGIVAAVHLGIHALSLRGAAIALLIGWLVALIVPWLRRPTLAAAAHEADHRLDGDTVFSTLVELSDAAASPALSWLQRTAALRAETAGPRLATLAQRVSLQRPLFVAAVAMLFVALVLQLPGRAEPVAVTGSREAGSAEFGDRAARSAAERRGDDSLRAQRTNRGAEQRSARAPGLESPADGVERVPAPGEATARPREFVTAPGAPRGPVAANRGSTSSGRGGNEAGSGLDRGGPGGDSSTAEGELAAQLQRMLGAAQPSSQRALAGTSAEYSAAPVGGASDARVLAAAAAAPPARVQGERLDAAAAAYLRAYSELRRLEP